MKNKNKKKKNSCFQVIKVAYNLFLRKPLSNLKKTKTHKNNNKMKKTKTHKNTNETKKKLANKSFLVFLLSKISL